MKHFLLGTVLAALAGPALAATDVGVSVNIAQPGFYGRIDIGNVPQPQLIYPAPVIIQQVPLGYVRQPIYLRVPPGHEKNWYKHCRKYNACGQPVYFVQDTWYRNTYVPAYRAEHERHDDHDGRGKKWKKHKDNGHGRD